MSVLIIDNYDSFTYNLYHYVQQLCPRVEVRRNDEISLDTVDDYSHILLSPGPGLPAQAGITMEVLARYNATKSILGVCLGCQAIAEFYGGELYNQQWVAHGVARSVHQKQSGRLLAGLPSSFAVGLYHSWAIDATTLPEVLRITSLSEMGTVMSLEHSTYRVSGVQFHPESIMTEGGLTIIENWLKA